MNMQQRWLRDEFARAALPGLVSREPRLAPAAIAEAAYEIADEMLKARIQSPGPEQWYCPVCNEHVDPASVTYDETHEKCGARVS